MGFYHLEENIYNKMDRGLYSLKTASEKGSP